jgi:hypothetical protein
MLKQAENRVKIEGILSEIDLDSKPFMKNGKEVEAMGGSIIVKVTQKISGKEKELMIPVYMFAAKLTNAGKPNPAYESIKTVKETFRSIASTGDEDAADRIRITGASVRMNEYYAADGHLVSFPRIHASFVNKIPKADCKPEATFALQFVVGDAMDEIKNDEPTGRYMIKGILPQYGGKVDVIPLFAESDGVISAVSTYWSKGDTVKANGRLDFSSTTEVTYEEVDFGEPIEKVRTINKSDLIITGGNQEPIEGEFAFDAADIQVALTERKERLEAQKEKDMSRMASKQTPPKSGTGFDLGF